MRRGVALAIALAALAGCRSGASTDGIESGTGYESSLTPCTSAREATDDLGKDRCFTYVLVGEVRYEAPSSVLEGIAAGMDKEVQRTKACGRTP